MRTKMINTWYHLRGSFWFLPASMALAAVGLSLATLFIDQLMPEQSGARHWWLYGGDPQGARTILSVIASSMITVAGVVFSITIVVLTLASSQFGPRLIRNFMTVRTNQIVLGTFVSTFIYAMLILRTVDAVEGQRFVPGLSVTVAFLLSLLSLGLLITFIHGVAESIQAQHIISRVRSEMDEAVERIFPERIGHEAQPSPDPIERVYDVPRACDRESCPVKAAASGYLQAVDEDNLMGIAVDDDLLIHLAHRPGHFITSGSVLVTVWPGHRVDDALAQRINAVFIVGPERTLEQDVEFAISQMVEIAVRALSPGINDPFTAITCIDWLGAALGQLTDRRMPAAHRFDHRHRLRVICNPFTFDGMVDAAFNMIRQHAAASTAVSIHMLETIATLAERTIDPNHRTALHRHAQMVAHGCEIQLAGEADRRDLATRYDAVVRILEGDAGR